MMYLTILAGAYAVDVQVHDDADLDGVFRAYDVDCGEWISVSGWAVEIEGRDPDERD